MKMGAAQQQTSRGVGRLGITDQWRKNFLIQAQTGLDQRGHAGSSACMSDDGLDGANGDTC